MKALLYATLLCAPLIIVALICSQQHLDFPEAWNRASRCVSRFHW